MSYIYGIFLTGVMDKNGEYKDQCLYVGSSNDFERRWKQHRQALEKNKHTNKSLQKAYNFMIESGVGEFTYKILYKINNDNTLLKFFGEMLAISYWKPTSNKALVQQGRNRVVFQKCDKDIAEKLLGVICTY
ncbi:GIY-YIG nuclease family protein [Clostridium beijerinckii]|uniref:GIY-YIG catalytic domain protein n=1 Tax=Clostridium beijerinckii TaxID=1520 RepID=A0A1S8SAH1_CLOBE|nr:GIY-YIG nuclease family protein [Clostridium beijerinckii]NRY59861.1 hypothetical protein [Clostridium beijerinckii]OOM62215.1 GIY-YIG catalytic domain protein [Clostridium beijerinckii]